MVCIELKLGEFKTSYLGQLFGYLQILDDKVRKPHENPSIGIILCQSANYSYAEYAVRDYSKPMGVYLQDVGWHAWKVTQGFAWYEENDGLAKNKEE